MSDDKNTASRLREFVKDLDKIADVFDKRIATEEAMLLRLTFVCGGDAVLARCVYNYVVLGHLSHYGYLRKKISGMSAIDAVRSVT